MEEDDIGMFSLIQTTAEQPGHSGHGWYWYDSEYPDEGSFGPFDSRAEAEANAKQHYRGEGVG